MSKLEASIAALRDVGEHGDAALAANTRVRVQRSLARRARSRRRLVQSSLVVSVLLVSTLSWAWSTGRLPVPFRSSPEPVIEESEKVPPAPPPQRIRSVPAVIAEPAREPAKPAATEALYRAAHELHFKGGDPAKALAAWDAYLAAEATGRFAIEARYNRGLVLARLGRYADARAALLPFAAGEVLDGYRRDEARAIVDRLDRLNGTPEAGD